MAANELGSHLVLDLTFKNFGVTDIAAGLGVLADAGHVPAGDAPGGVLLPTNGGGVAGTIGVTVELIKAGATGRVRVLGVYPCTAAGTVTYGGIVQIQDVTAHLGQVKTCIAATRQLGMALDTATDGQQVRVLIIPAANA